MVVTRLRKGKRAGSCEAVESDLRFKLDVVRCLQDLQVGSLTKLLGCHINLGESVSRELLDVLGPKPDRGTGE